jgi:hypothetical protein
MFFSWVANRTFSHIPKGSLINFIDDTTNHSRHFRPHLLIQQEMYDALRTNKLVLKIAKSHFLYPSVRILGHIYSEHGRTPDPSLVKAVLDLAPPQDVKGVRYLLGLAVFNREYIPHYSEITRPLQDLMKNGVDVAADWTAEVHGKALQALKHALTTAPCLLTIDPSKPFTIHADACKIGRGPEGQFYCNRTARTTGDPLHTSLSVSEIRSIRGAPRNWKQWGSYMPSGTGASIFAYSGSQP